MPQAGWSPAPEKLNIVAVKTKTGDAINSCGGPNCPLAYNPGSAADWLPVGDTSPESSPSNWGLLAGASHTETSEAK